MSKIENQGQKKGETGTFNLTEFNDMPQKKSKLKPISKK